MLQTLTCHAGHEWEREATRGRKPLYCPKHKPAEQSQAAVATDEHVETLTCGAGHTWTRPKARGRKPPYCPEHRLQQTPSTSSVSIPSANIMTPAIQAVLDGEKTELQRKLNYTINALTNPLTQTWREPGDWNLLIDTHKRLAQQAEKATA